MTTTATPAAAEADAPPARRDRTGLWYLGAVLVGAVLMTGAALQQPFNQNELRQIAPYGSDSYAEITGATHQPPLAPLIGAAFQHLFGMGQLQQRLEPLLAGIGTLIVMSLLMRRLRSGYAGVIGVWVMATMPLMVRHAAYTRPYMLPMFFMVLFIYCAQRWLDDRQWRWLAMSALAAVALPLSRVPEAIVFLGAGIAILALVSVLGRLTWSRTIPLITVLAASLVFVGYPQYKTLAAEASQKTLDTSVSGFLARFDTGVHELLTYTVPLMAHWLPWWPVALLVIVASVALPGPRRMLLRWWWFWPLLAAPVVFLLAYHFLNTYPFWIRHYRPRYGSFFAPVYVCMVVAVASWLLAAASVKRWARVGLAVLVLGTVVGQIPATAQILLHDEAADFDDVADVLTHDLPDDAIVLYDVPNPGTWGQPFSATPRYMGETPYVGKVNTLMHHKGEIPRDGPVYVLMLKGQCAWSVDCNLRPVPWRHTNVAGWKVKTQFDWLTLYEPKQPVDGWQGVIDAGRSFGKAMGPSLGYSQIFVAANLLEKRGQAAHARALIDWMYEHASPETAARIKKTERAQNLNPFTRPDARSKPQG